MTQKALCIMFLDTAVLKNVSSANTLCALAQTMILIDYVWKKNKRYDISKLKLLLPLA